MSTAAPVVNAALTSNGTVNSSNQTSLEEDLFKDDLSSGGQSKKGWRDYRSCVRLSTLFRKGIWKNLLSEKNC